MATTVVSRRETASLIGSDKVDGTPVYGADDRKFGSVQRVMIDKISGKVAYAVISFGGFLGMGEDYYPVPWTSLKYDTTLGGYRVGVTEEQLLQNMTATLSGIGRTATEIKTSTTTIGRSCGTDAIAGAPNDFLQLARIETGQ
jgi:hypothetical protein